jgi:hypothetical protein
LETDFRGPVNDAKKADIRKLQAPLAKLTLQLQDMQDDMEALVESKALEIEESKFWRVTFLYALAQVKLRVSFSLEANLAFGLIIGDNLPDSKGSDMWQLVSSQKMKIKKEDRKNAEEAGEMFAEIAKEHSGTPWAVAAKRNRSLAIGLEWQPQAPDAPPSDKDK